MEEQPPKSGKKEILIIDDTTEILQLFSEILRSEGYGVRPASSGKLALKSIELKQPDLILLDIKMPDMNGFEVCRQLKADKNYCSIPVVFISGVIEEQDVNKGIEVGGIDFLTKPCMPEDLLEKIESILNPES